MKSMVYSAYAKKAGFDVSKYFTIGWLANLCTMAGAALLAGKFFVIAYLLMLTGAFLWYNIVSDNELKFLNGFYIICNIFGLFSNLGLL